jgi:hypothetical protein
VGSDDEELEQVLSSVGEVPKNVAVEKAAAKKILKDIRIKVKAESNATGT